MSAGIAAPPTIRRMGQVTIRERDRIVGPVQHAVAPGGARRLFIRAGRPQTNGVVERVQGTILEECWKLAFARSLIPKDTGVRLDLRTAT
jgi:transposase InsO family protein